MPTYYKNFDDIHPQPKQRPRWGCGRVYSPKSDFEKELMKRMKAIVKENPKRFPICYTMKCVITLRMTSRRADIDNIVKAVWDCMLPREQKFSKKTGAPYYVGGAGWIQDDSLIDELHVIRRDPVDDETEGFDIKLTWKTR